MKKLRYCIFCMLFLFLISFGINVFAANSVFQTEQLQDKEKTDFLSAINITLLNEEPQKDAIDCFDVTDDGLIAVSHSDNGNKKYICVYDGMDFVYGYELEAHGTIFLECADDLINIHFVRGEYMVSVNSREVVDVALVKDTRENSARRDNYIFSKQNS